MRGLLSCPAYGARAQLPGSRRSIEAGVDTITIAIKITPGPFDGAKGHRRAPSLAAAGKYRRH